MVQRSHTGMVLRRLSGTTDNTAPVLTLITQFGGGKTHTLTALYHQGASGEKAARYPGVSDLLRDAGRSSVPEARVDVFVRNAWDPQDGKETLWIDIARQLAGDAGVAALGTAAKTTPPGTESIARVFKAADAPVLLLFDEVLNFLNRHRGMAESLHAFIQNLTVAMTGTTHGAAVISLSRSQVEMTDWDMQWQDKITKVVRRVAKDLIGTSRRAGRWRCWPSGSPSLHPDAKGSGASRRCNPGTTDKALRKALLRYIAGFANMVSVGPDQRSGRDVAGRLARSPPAMAGRSLP